MKPYYLAFNTKNKLVSGLDTERLFKEYSELGISLELKEDIKQRIYAEQDFEVTVQELQQILPTLDKRIEELVKHPDFNPFKEELRKRYPEQYGSQPFKFNGTTYYLYHKGREFYVDSLIYGVLGFKKLIKDHIAANKPLRYVYKE
ncbi:hypothetical protein [Chryseobacterium arthrosphaerae]|uniref:hypothetical protein n=1 Tax=Chryseobacterium arthrosphaerae TaxID=651561 RepID=UPI001E2B2C52|nr:hypothetical protein [Chryseobacterium arthrosphaerae]UEQ75365.1 hypothetical protein J8N07_17115 [Chryseobacterium arthrosphaerae]